MDTRTFADTLGRRVIAGALGVGVTAVNNAVQRGVFPASWYDPLERLAAQAGVSCERTMFSFKELQVDRAMSPVLSQQPRSPGT